MVGLRHGCLRAPLNFEELGFSAGIKGCVNFNMTNPVTKKKLLIRRIQRYKGLLWGNHVINVNLIPPHFFGRVEKCIVPYVARLVIFFWRGWSPMTKLWFCAQNSHIQQPNLSTTASQH
jgi:hypothetical protein